MSYGAPNNGVLFAEPQEDYQKKLHAFLAEIPPLGGEEIKSGSPSPARYPYTQQDIDALGVVKTDPRFKKYTGWDHKALLQKWLVDRTTTCNEFVGKCVTMMGYQGKDPIGRFDIADQLLIRGLGHVWVPAGTSGKPAYGDIYRLYEAKPDHNAVPTNHMGISLYVNGSDWYTADSGQGGASNGHDIVKRNRKPWNPTSLRGWISMKALLSADEPLPYWLGGWWEVEEGPYDTWYYYFGAGGKVSFSSVRPVAITAPPISALFVGHCLLKGMYNIEITWRDGDGIEKLNLARQDIKNRKYVMEGKTARGIELTATRLLPYNPTTW